MKSKGSFFRYSVLILPLLMGVLASCGEDDYQYPSVKLEFLTAHSGADGCLQTAMTDDGKVYPVVEDLSGIHLDANSSARLVSNYGEEMNADGTAGLKLYASLKTISPLPQPAENFKEGVKMDPATMQSIWMGRDYLNMILEIKAQNGKHRFHFIEEEVTTEAATGHRVVRLMLYYDAGDDVQAYTKRAYASVPLKQYAAEGVVRVTVFFSLHTYSGEVNTYQFEYLPNESR